MIQPLLKTLYLPQETIAIRPNTQIWSISQFAFNNDIFRAFTAYDFNRDIYQREGYYASSLLLSHARIAGQALRHWLEGAQYQTANYLNQQAVFWEKLSIEPPLESVDFETDSDTRQQAFLWLNGDRMEDIWDRIQEDAFFENYGKIYISSDEEVICSLDPTLIPILNPPDPMPCDEVSYDREDSLIYSYENGDMNIWHNQPEKQPVNDKRTNGWKRWFGRS